MNRLPTIVEALDRTMETSAKQEVGKFRAKYFEKKNPSKNGYFVKDVQIEEVISFNKKTIKIA